MTDRLPFLLAVDVGTSSLKAVCYERGGDVLASASRRYDSINPQSGWAEANPQDWWLALQAVVAELSDCLAGFKAIEVIALTGQMHTGVLLDENNAVLPPTILWLDRRAANETVELQQTFHLPPYQLNSTYTLPKLVWLARHEPEVMAKVRCLLWPKDYLRFRLTGRLLTDCTEAGGAALLDWQSMTWATERLEWAGISPAILPPLCRPTDEAGPLLPEIARDWDLRPDVKVLVGAGDVLALVTGAPPSPGRVTCSMGSSSMVYCPSPAGQVVQDPVDRIYTYPLLPYNLVGGVSSTSGAALQWAYETLFGASETFSAAVSAAMQVPDGAGDLIFLPFLSGERSPFWSDHLRGSFYGLTLKHSRAHMLRAVLEGVAFSLRYLLDIFEECGVPVTEIALAGGGAEIQGWPAIFSKICKRPVVLYSGQETVTRALYAYACLSIGEDVTFEQALLRTFQPAERVEASSQNDPVYDRLYQQYCQLAEFADEVLSRFQNQ